MSVYGVIAGSGGAGSDARGSLFEPEEVGAQGGSGGGKGGSTIRLQVGSVLYMDGTLDTNGANTSDHAGGGSGGSVWITVGKFRHFSSSDTGFLMVLI